MLCLHWGSLTYFRAACLDLSAVVVTLGQVNISLMVYYSLGKHTHMADRLSRLVSPNDIVGFRSEFPEYDTRVLFPHWCQLNADI